MSWRSAILVAAVSVACLDDGDAGSLGTFAVTATLTGNTCGPHAAPASFAFSANLSVNEGVLTWRPVGGSRTVGSYDLTEGTFRVELSQDLTFREGNARLGIAPCVVRRYDLLEGRIDLGASDAGASDAGTTDGARSDAQASDPADASTDASADASTTRRRFRATEVILYGATRGSDCSELIGVEEGQVSALPCESRYVLEGVGQ